jgi:hypothetical protein
MRFQVPQFINVEDKIFGPLTAKQFIYVAGGAGLCYAAYNYLPFYISIFIILIIGGLALALAFYRVNNQPFIFILEAAVKYFFSQKFYVWRKVPKKTMPQKNQKASEPNDFLVPKMSDSKLREMSWKLDTTKNLK